MDITWKGPDGTGCLYANPFTVEPYQSFNVNILLPQTDKVWNQYGVLVDLKSSAHPTHATAFVDGEEIGKAETVDAAKRLIADHLTSLST